MAPHLDQRTAEETLRPILSTIKQCIEDAWSEWRTFYAPKHTVLDPRARAAIVYCHIVDRAKVLFAGVNDVTVGASKGVFRIFVGDEIALRFKKARKNGTTSNISTNQQKLIDLQLTIPGVLPGTMLNAVYQLDELQRDLRNLMVTLQLDRRVQWSIQIDQNPATPLASMPAPTIESQPATPRARVKGAVQKKRTQAAK